MSFLRYMHLEKWGSAEVEGIELGTSYVFPKIDGTNAQVWFKKHIEKIDCTTIGCGSRNRELSLENDNAGFFAAMMDHNGVVTFLTEYPNLRLYGEWLVPHTLKTYRDDAWNKFYVFDVYNDETQQYLSYDAYKPLLEEFGIDYLAPIAIVKNGNSESFYKCLEKNVFLIKDGEGVGEGVVIKNYDFINRFGNVVWAKFISTEFKEKHHKEMGAPEIGTEPIELKIAEKYIDLHLVNKVVAKIENEGGWSNKSIPRLLETVYHDLIKEEMWDIVKEHKNPAINFKALKAFTIGRIKQIRGDLF